MYTIGISVILFAGCIGGLIFGPLCIIGGGFHYNRHSFFRFYVISHGLMQNMLTCFHMTIAAFNFLYLIYGVRGFTLKEFLHDWFLKRDGFRYVLILVLNSFSVYCYVHNAFFPQNNFTLQMYPLLK
jgi:hypothetical protein